VAENNELRKKLESLEAIQLAAMVKDLGSNVVTVNGSTFIGKIVKVSSAEALKKLCFDTKAFAQLVVLAANIDGKAAVAIAVSEELITKGLEAPKMIKEQVTPLIKGGGGGQKTLATAGGQDATQLEKVLSAIQAIL
jgi:alanyl-tRNA synthetase